MLLAGEREVPRRLPPVFLQGKPTALSSRRSKLPFRFLRRRAEGGGREEEVNTCALSWVLLRYKGVL